MKRISYAAPLSARIEHYRPSEPLFTMVHARRYRPVVVRSEYAIHQRRSSTCGARFEHA